MAREPIDDLIDLGGAGLIVSDVGEALPEGGPGVVRLGVHWQGGLPDDGLDDFDMLISGAPEAPAPWVGVTPAQVDGVVEMLQTAVAQQPLAATVVAQVLRMSRLVAFDEALMVESLAYSMLLGSAPFQAWRAATPVRERADDDGPRVLVEDADGALALRLNRPAARNAFDARMRDELCEALAFAAEHPDAPPVVLSGEGPAFSAGGDLDEFGRADDPGVAHLVRNLRSPARQVRQLGERLTVRVHGACVGAGIEVPAAAARVVAREDAFFRLPEVSMGLIPGAGGTATIPRRIGRHRACFMAISGADIGVQTALSWRLIDGIER